MNVADPWVPCNTYEIQKRAAAKPLSLFRQYPKDVPGPHVAHVGVDTPTTSTARCVGAELLCVWELLGMWELLGDVKKEISSIAGGENPLSLLAL